LNRKNRILKNDWLLEEEEVAVEEEEEEEEEARRSREIRRMSYEKVFRGTF
jgi:hypothetical protein